MIKIIHTSDWHLGHQLHGFDRDHEHQQFLNWLSDLLITEQVDVLLVSGDVFDTANPPASAWQMLYRFLAEISKALPDLDVIIAGGNHDSPSKLDAPHDLLKAFDLHMVGGIRRDNDGSLDTDRMLVSVSGKDGSKAIVMAVPFLRSADLRTQHLDEVDDRLIAGVEDVYREMLEAAEKQRHGGEAIIAMGHLYMASGQLSEMSERRVLGGNQHALPASIFDDKIDYVALGHLHLAQKVAGQERIRYCGSPIPLSISERDYKHQVLGVELADGKLASVTPHYVPRAVDILRKPSKPQPLDVVLQELKNWQPDTLPRESQPLVEVPVLMDAPQPMLREKIHAALEGKPVRLARIAPHYTQQDQAEHFAAKRLDDVSPEQVFQYGWEQKFDGAPPQEICDAFHALLTMVEEQEEGQA
ncbi:exonuclease SbcCD subunit D C-terminal domain-containing protein [Grimontia hollisae]|uniref:exonuclease SbcCD subunit D C-terminal domain-containing protein n=1 Tax=Grimontia hollisae TaxID=673 RepID=UPI0029343C41|nr:exonuclease SbcCD subunit D C-terminal domain-containing protein [Grimontia hollisae]